jgi:hypothetical protein
LQHLSEFLNMHEAVGGRSVCKEWFVWMGMAALHQFVDWHVGSRRALDLESKKEQLTKQDILTLVSPLMKNTVLTTFKTDLAKLTARQYLPSDTWGARLAKWTRAHCGVCTRKRGKDNEHMMSFGPNVRYTDSWICGACQTKSFERVDDLLADGVTLPYIVHSRFTSPLTLCPLLTRLSACCCSLQLFYAADEDILDDAEGGRAVTMMWRQDATSVRAHVRRLQKAREDAEKKRVARVKVAEAEWRAKEAEERTQRELQAAAREAARVEEERKEKRRQRERARRAMNKVEREELERLRAKEKADQAELERLRALLAHSSSSSAPAPASASVASGSGAVPIEIGDDDEEEE